MELEISGMKNKYVMTRRQNLSFVRRNLKNYLRNSMSLARYEFSDELISQYESHNRNTEEEIALDNFLAAYNYLLDNTDKEADYDQLIVLHSILMKDLMDTFSNHLTEEQIDELNRMINQPAKANTEIAIDVMLYILDKRLFSDGDVRAALMFANKIMIDNGCGIITVTENNKDVFREKLKEYKNNKDYDIKDWIYKYCIKGPKLDH